MLYGRGAVIVFVMRHCNVKEASSLSLEYVVDIFVMRRHCLGEASMLCGCGVII